MSRWRRRTLPDDQRDLALLLGAEGYRIAQSDQTAGGLQAAVLQTPPGLDRIIRYRSSSLGAHLDHAGRRLAVPGQDGTVTIYNVASGRVEYTLTWPRPRNTPPSAQTTASWRQAASTARSQSGTPSPAGSRVVRCWSAATARRPSFRPDRCDRMFAVTYTGQLTTWDRHDPEHPRQVGSTQYFAGGTPPEGYSRS